MTSSELTEMLVSITRANIEDNIIFQDMLVNFAKLNISVAEIADALLVSQTTIINWREGKNLPRLNTRKIVRSYVLKQIRTKLSRGINANNI